jgi:multiple antibiotic resistance protein
MSTEMPLVLKFFALSYGALLPVINPVGSALMFLAVVGEIPYDEFRRLARRVAVSMVLFLLVFEACGAALLNFFGISLPVVQLGGGIVLAAMGWRMLNEEGHSDGQSASPAHDKTKLDQEVFYPLTFPISAGPAVLVVTLTLSAHASGKALISSVVAHLGIALAIAGLGVTIWLCYAYAPKIAKKIAPSTIQGVLRVVAFVLLCIGAQIATNGWRAIMKSVPQQY